MSNRPPLFDAPSVCPFCAIHCCDIDQANAVGCELRSESLARLASPSPRIAGEQATAKEVRQWADGQSFSSASSTAIVAGQMSLRVATDLVRWSLQFDRPLSAERDDSIAALSHTIARDGVVTASLGEIQRLADRVIVIGDLATPYPRVDRWLPSDASVLPIESIDSAMLADWMARPADVCEGGDYVAVLVGPRAFGDDASEQVIASERLVRWIWNLNRESQNGKFARRAVLTFINPTATIDDVYRYQTNEALPIVADDQVSQAIRIGTSAVGATGKHPVRLQIGGVDFGPESSQAYLPAMVGGYHTRDSLVRGDGTVALPVLGSESTDLLDPVIELQQRLTQNRSVS